MPDANDVILEFQCPKCAKRLKAGSQVAGRQAKCPKCGQSVKVPGAPATPPKEDDQWLSLDSPAIADVAQRQQAADQVRNAQELLKRKARADAKRRSEKPAADSITSDRSVTTPGAGKQPVEKHVSGNQPVADSPNPQLAAAKRSIFDDDLPELAELEPSKKPVHGIEKILAAHAEVEDPEQGKSPRDGKQPLARDAHHKTTQQPPLVAELEETDPEYRILCKTCGTAQYVRVSSQGMKVKCPDCFSQFKIPPPSASWTPKSKKKQIPVSTEPDVELAAPDELHHAQTESAQRSRASKILERAVQDVSEEDIEKLYDGDFDTAGFVRRTFGFLRDPIMLGQLAGYGLVFGLLFALAQFGINSIDTDFGKGLLLLVVIGGPLAALMFALPMLSGGLALIESVANRQERVTEWPGFNLFDNVGDVIAVVVALTAAMLPGFFVGMWLGGDLPGAGRIEVSAMLVSTFVLFPVFLLSMLDNGSIFQPISDSVAKSFTGASEAWGGYFLKTLVAYFFVAVLWNMLLGKSPVLAGIAGFLLPLLVFFTCQQIGALADSISDHLSFEFAAADKDAESEIEEVKS